MSGAGLKRHVLIIGAGFAGVQVARGLGAGGVRATLLDRQNYHLFQPLLYQVATAALSPADIAEPVRRMLRRFPSVEVQLGEVTGIDVAARRVTLADGNSLAYDILVLAAGATHAYFGHDEWAEFAPSLKSIADARKIRSRLLRSFEQAEMSADAGERKRLMTFIVVGGGPSGVELAGAIAELARHTLAKDFRHIDAKSTTVFLLEASTRILAAFPADLARYAQCKLASLGVTVRENCPVKNISRHGVVAGEDTIPAALAIWTAGVKASAAGILLGVPTDKTGRVMVNRDLSVPGLSNVYALGDVALVRNAAGDPLPGLAQVAKQQGHYLGRAIVKKIRNGAKAPDFEFHNRGNAAIIGRQSAIFDFGWSHLTGASAWFLWALVHIYLLAGFQHRVLVAVQWLWRYATYDHGARLIVEPPWQTGADHAPGEDSAP
ncbi:MAG TPA: NAD(P)/FAD-dependent oxidoreductase [Steroidobacteraceae bacterium]|nr:NAD(P)/FAD-dependent oxidoreductase [Steroidobacteraceae bacterium]